MYEDWAIDYDKVYTKYVFVYYVSGWGGGGGSEGGTIF